MQNRDITVGVVGMGLMGERHAAIYRQLPGVRLAGVVDIDPKVRALVHARLGVASYQDLRDFLAVQGLDAVSICLPDNLHRDATLEAFDAGLHVLLEKPLATTVSDGERLVQAAGCTDRVFMVGHLLRFDPRYDLARQHVRRGDVGQLAHVYARRNSALGSAQRYGSATRLTWHVAVHDVDLVRWISGREVVRVTAHASDRRLHEAGHLDSMLALLVLDDGTPCVVESCWILPPHFKSGIDAQLEIVGTDGVIEVTGLEQGLRVANATGLWQPDTMRFVEHADGRVGGVLKTELEHFVACIRTGQAPLVTGEDGLAALRVTEAMEASIASARTVAL